jgi:hypothetical protein
VRSPFGIEPRDWGPEVNACSNCTPVVGIKRYTIAVNLDSAPNPIANQVEICLCRSDSDPVFDTVRTVSEVVSLTGLWDTVGMSNQQKRPQALEDRKVQKLVERIDQKQALQANAAETRLPASPPTT